MQREPTTRIGEEQPILETARKELTEWVLADTEKIVFVSEKARVIFDIQVGMPVEKFPLIVEVLKSGRQAFRLFSNHFVARTVVGVPLRGDSGEICGALVYAEETDGLSESIMLDLVDRMNQERSIEDALRVMADSILKAFNLLAVGVWLWNNRWFQELALSVRTSLDRSVAQRLIQDEMALQRELAEGNKDWFEITVDEAQTTEPCFNIELLKEIGVKRVLVMPLTHLGTFLGIIAFFCADEDVVVEKHLKSLGGMAPIISTYVHVKQLKEAATERELSLNLLLRGTEILVQAESEEQILTEAGEMTMIFYIEAGFFLLRGTEGWKVCAPYGRLKTLDQGLERVIKKYVGVDTLDDYQPHLTPQVKLVQEDPLDSPSEFPWTKAIILPIQVQGTIGGELWLLDYRENPLEQYQEIFAAFTRGLGVAMDTIRQRKELERMAMTDVLTGLLNRKGFEARAQEELAGTLRRKSSLLLLIIDLDGFKKLNDTYGHPAGDTALSKIASNLQRAVRQNDIVARTGGDEFSVILTDMTKEKAYPVIERIRSRMGLEEFGVGASIGVAEFPAEAENLENLYKIADRRMYYSKYHGKGQIVLEDHEDDESSS